MHKTPSASDENKTDSKKRYHTHAFTYLLTLSSVSGSGRLIYFKLSNNNYLCVLYETYPYIYDSVEQRSWERRSFWRIFFDNLSFTSTYAVDTHHTLQTRSEIRSGQQYYIIVCTRRMPKGLEFSGPQFSKQFVPRPAGRVNDKRTHYMIFCPVHNNL